MPIYKSRGRQGNRQGQRVVSTRSRRPSRDQYGHRLYSVMGRGSHACTGLNGTVYVDQVERFKGTAKACIEYCKAHRSKHYQIAALFDSRY